MKEGEHTSTALKLIKYLCMHICAQFLCEFVAHSVLFLKLPAMVQGCFSICLVGALDRRDAGANDLKVIHQEQIS